MFATVRLKKNQERRLKAGHLWIYSNEIDSTPLSQFKRGELVNVVTDRGKMLGTGYINPNSLICVRMISFAAAVYLDAALLTERIKNALSLRQAIFPKPYYRLVFGEADFLPGLVVDRFAEVLVVQITTAGMEQFTDEIVQILRQLVNPHSILLRNDTSVREIEGLPKIISAALGEPPEQVLLEENEVLFNTSIWQGQKTGWFYDHRSNRARLEYYVKDRQVLDVFSYIGGWGIQAAYAGAQHVTCIDSSASALEQLTKNAELNLVAEKISTILGDAFEQLKILLTKKQKFDVIIVDPPAFIKRRKDFHTGLSAYRRLNQLAMQLLNPEGILVSASCSLHLNREQMLDVIRESANAVGRFAQILEQGHQAPDHPVHPAISETDYLKAFFVRVL